MSLSDFKLPVLVGLIVLGAYSIYQYGIDTERARNTIKENKRIIQLQEKALTLMTKNRDLERSSALHAESLKTLYEGKMQDEKAQADRVIADLRNGNKRLSIAIRNTGTCTIQGGSIASGIKGSNGETRAELPRKTAEAFVAIGRDADLVTVERNKLADEVLACRKQYKALAQLCEAR